MSYVKVQAISYEDKPHAIGFYFETEDGSDLYPQQVLDALVDFMLGEGAEFMVRNKNKMN